MSAITLFRKLIDAFMAKDLEAALSVFADDAILIDPHYPQPRMRGRAEIERGLRWGLSSLDKPGFTRRNSAINGDIGFFEVDTKHRLKIGMTIAFDQLFVVKAATARSRVCKPTSPIPRPAWRD
jgi:ketosteroid isomerase-like protein